MKTWITILIALCACLQVQAQNTAEERAKAKEEARQEQAVLDSIYLNRQRPLSRIRILPWKPTG